MGHAFTYSLHCSLTEDDNYEFGKNNEILEDGKDTQSHPQNEMEESSSTLLDSELIITTTGTITTNSKQFSLPSVSTACCDSEQPSSEQDCFNLHGNLEDQLSSPFEHGSAVNHDEDLDMTFPRSVYGGIGDKDMSSFHPEGTFNLHKSLKFSILTNIVVGN